MIKKSLFVIIMLTVITAVALPLSFRSGADGNSAVITVENSDLGVAGKEFTLSVSISENSGFSSAELSINYNNNSLTLVSVSAGAALKNAYTLEAPDQTSSNPYTVKISSQQDITDNGELLKVRFRLSSSVKLNSQYSVFITCASGKMKNSAGETVEVSAVSGGFYLTCEHKYIDSVVNPTCTAEGYTNHQCSECRKSYMDDFTDKLPHTWKTVSSTGATCTEDGLLNRRCSVCGETEIVKNGDALGHDLDEGIVTPSTCETEGFVTYTCRRCGESLRGETLPLAEHTLVNKVQRQATCQEKGIVVTYCEVCERSFGTEELPVINHEYEEKEVIEATHTERGWTAFECKYCGIILKDDYTEPKPYDIVYSVTVAASCDHTGVRTGVCSDGCGYTVEEEIPVSAHSYGTWSVETEPTEEQAGVEIRYCAVCGIKDSREIPPIERTIEKHNQISMQSILIISGAAVAVLTVILIVIAVFKKQGKR